MSVDPVGTPMDHACPSDEQLEQLRHGELSSRDAEALQSHLDSCDRCREAVHAFDQDEQLLDDLRDAWRRRGDQVDDADETATASGANVSRDAAAARFGSYELIGLLGAGGMGRVYRARHADTGEVVALKILKAEHQASAEIRARFLREGRAMSELSHPNILRVLECPSDGERIAIAMELADGGSLRGWIRRNVEAKRQPPPARVIDIALQAARGLGAAHGHGLVHRDIKPSNLLFDGAGCLKVSDFGVVQALDSTTWVTGTGQRIGTPAYMSPEQCRGERVTAASDVYALGVTLFEMATGRLPFVVDGDSPFALMLKHMSEAPPDPARYHPDLPDAVAAIILRCLNKSLDDRFANGDELAMALDRATRAKPIDVAADQTPHRTNLGVDFAAVRRQLEALPQRSIIAWACRCARRVQRFNDDPRVDAAISLAESAALARDDDADQPTSARMLARKQSLRAASLAAAYPEGDAEMASVAAARSAAAASSCAAAICVTDAAADAVFALENAVIACRMSRISVTQFWRQAQRDYRRLRDARLGEVGTIGRAVPEDFWQGR